MRRDSFALTFSALPERIFFSLTKPARKLDSKYLDRCLFVRKTNRPQNEWETIVCWSSDYLRDWELSFWKKLSKRPKKAFVWNEKRRINATSKRKGTKVIKNNEEVHFYTDYNGGSLKKYFRHKKCKFLVPTLFI